MSYNDDMNGEDVEEYYAAQHDFEKEQDRNVDILIMYDITRTHYAPYSFSQFIETSIVVLRIERYFSWHIAMIVRDRF